MTQSLFSTAPDLRRAADLRPHLLARQAPREPRADDPFVKKVLGKASPAEVAERLVKGTKLKDVAYRKKLWEGGAAAVAAAAREDALLELALRVDEDGRAIRKKYEDEIESVTKRNAELIAKARFATEGTSTYPDATFTPRLSYGPSKGYKENGTRGEARSRIFAGAFERAHRPRALRPAAELARREAAARPRDAVRLGDHERHHRRQLRLAGGRQGRADRRAGLRRQHPLAGRGLRLRRQREPRGGGAQRRRSSRRSPRFTGADRLVQELRPPAGPGASR